MEWSNDGDEDATEDATEVYGTGHAETQMPYTLFWTQDILLRRVEIFWIISIGEKSHNYEICDICSINTVCLKSHKITYTDGALQLIPSKMLHLMLKPHTITVKVSRVKLIHLEDVTLAKDDIWSFAH